MSILITGGYGYIGSHSLVELSKFMTKNKEMELEIIVVDNLSNSNENVGIQLHKILHQEIGEKDQYFSFKKLDITDFEALKGLFESQKDLKKPIKSIIHFAAKKAVGESTQLPLLYYQVNVVGTLNLLMLCLEFQVDSFIFSSSATVYGNQPLAREDSPIQPANPYGNTKVMVETIMSDACKANPKFKCISLRYFNPCGAHPSGLIGEVPLIANNLFPAIEQVFMGKRENIVVHGNDYPTLDGTGVRDYIHIVDLAIAHAKAYEKAKDLSGFHVFNIGSSRGYSVLEILDAYSKASDTKIPFVIGPRRSGDVATVIADPKKAEEEMNFKVKYSLDEICKDSVNFVRKQMLSSK